MEQIVYEIHELVEQLLSLPSPSQLPYSGASSSHYSLSSTNELSLSLSSQSDALSLSQQPFNNTINHRRQHNNDFNNRDNGHCYLSQQTNNEVDHRYLHSTNKNKTNGVALTSAKVKKHPRYYYRRLHRLLCHLDDYGLHFQDLRCRQQEEGEYQDSADSCINNKKDDDDNIATQMLLLRSMAKNDLVHLLTILPSSLVLDDLYHSVCYKAIHCLSSEFLVLEPKDIAVLITSKLCIILSCFNNDNEENEYSNDIFIQSRRNSTNINQSRNSSVDFILLGMVLELINFNLLQEQQNKLSEEDVDAFNIARKTPLDYVPLQQLLLTVLHASLSFLQQQQSHLNHYHTNYQQRQHQEYYKDPRMDITARASIGKETLIQFQVFCGYVLEYIASIFTKDSSLDADDVSFNMWLYEHLSSSLASRNLQEQKQHRKKNDDCFANNATREDEHDGKNISVNSSLSPSRQEVEYIIRLIQNYINQLIEYTSDIVDDSSQIASEENATSFSPYQKSINDLGQGQNSILGHHQQQHQIVRHVTLAVNGLQILQDLKLLPKETSNVTQLCSLLSCTTESLSHSLFQAYANYLTLSIQGSSAATAKKKLGRRKADNTTPKGVARVSRNYRCNNDDSSSSTNYQYIASSTDASNGTMHAGGLKTHTYDPCIRQPSSDVDIGEDFDDDEEHVNETDVIGLNRLSITTLLRLAKFHCINHHNGNTPTNNQHDNIDLAWGQAILLALGHCPDSLLLQEESHPTYDRQNKQQEKSLEYDEINNNAIKKELVDSSVDEDLNGTKEHKKNNSKPHISRSSTRENKENGELWKQIQHLYEHVPMLKHCLQAAMLSILYYPTATVIKTKSEQEEEEEINQDQQQKYNIVQKLVHIVQLSYCSNINDTKDPWDDYVYSKISIAIQKR